MSYRTSIIKLDLSQARSNVRYQMPGHLVQPIRASSFNATASVRIRGADYSIDGGDDGFPLRLQDSLTLPNQFNELFISNAAQSGESIELMVVSFPVSPGHFDFKVADRGVIQGIANAVEVINQPATLLDVEDAQAAALMQDRNALRAGLTDLTSATSGIATNTTVEVVSAVANVNGAIIRVAGVSGNGATGRAYVRVGGSVYALYLRNGGGSSATYGISHVKDIFVPAGLNIECYSSSSTQTAFATVEVL